MAPIKVGDYLFRRLRELGIKSVFGVPGDYELALLDLVGDNGLEWKGNANELIASYAADGYGRINGVGAFVTTFGPGELSAYCGMAGQFCEFVPVVHVVGYPTTTAANAHTIMHHTLGDGRFDMYEEMSKQITAGTAVLKDPKEAAAEIDKLLTIMMQQSRPVYLGVPTDLAYEPIDDEGLKTPIDISLPKDDPGTLKIAIAEIRARLETAVMPTVVVDGNAVRNKVLDEVHDLLELLEFPTFVTSMGKGGFNEDLPYFAGVYGGAGSHDGVKAGIDASDAVLWLGRFPSDFNTAEFTMDVAESKIIDMQRFFTTIGGKKVDVKMKYLLDALIENIKQAPMANTAGYKVTWNPYPLQHPTVKGAALTQDFMWSAFGEFFKSGDLIIGETGTSAFGLGDTKLPKDSFMFNQTIFGSIGYATGAAVGAFTAARESGKFKRCILVTGEGSFHLTAQAMADLLRWELKPIIFILNNGGYTVERLIHGKEADYNAVALWDYGNLAKTFGPAHPSKYHGPVDTDQKFKDLIYGTDLDPNHLHVVEVVLGPLDAPMSVAKTTAAIEAFNKKKAIKGV